MAGADRSRRVEQAFSCASDRTLSPRCWRPTAVPTAFRLHGWRQYDRQAERLAQWVWCALDQEGSAA